MLVLMLLLVVFGVGVVDAVGVAVLVGDVIFHVV